MLRIEYVNRPGAMNFGTPHQNVAPFLEAVEEAIRTQQVYWVDWNYEDMPSFPIRSKDSTFDRLLRAIQDRQLVGS